MDGSGVGTGGPAVVVVVGATVVFGADVVGAAVDVEAVVVGAIVVVVAGASVDVVVDDVGAIVVVVVEVVVFAVVVVFGLDASVVGASLIGLIPGTSVPFLASSNCADTTEIMTNTTAMPQQICRQLENIFIIFL